MPKVVGIQFKGVGRIYYFDPLDLEFEPGEKGQYSDGAFYMLSRVITAKCGMKADDLLMKRVFYPLGFREAAWSKCPHGNLNSGL